MIKVAIADDNENMVRMLTDLVSRDNELHVVGTARNGEEACEVIREKRAGYCTAGYCDAKVGRAGGHGPNEQR